MTGPGCAMTHTREPPDQVRSLVRTGLGLATHDRIGDKRRTPDQIDLGGVVGMIFRALPHRAGLDATILAERPDTGRSQLCVIFKRVERVTAAREVIGSVEVGGIDTHQRAFARAQIHHGTDFPGIAIDLVGLFGVVGAVKGRRTNAQIFDEIDIEILGKTPGHSCHHGQIVFHARAEADLTAGMGPVQLPVEAETILEETQLGRITHLEFLRIDLTFTDAPVDPRILLPVLAIDPPLQALFGQIPEFLDVIIQRIMGPMRRDQRAADDVHVVGRFEGNSDQRIDLVEAVLVTKILSQHSAQFDGDRLAGIMAEADRSEDTEKRLALDIAKVQQFMVLEKHSELGHKIRGACFTCVLSRRSRRISEILTDNGALGENGRFLGHSRSSGKTQGHGGQNGRAENGRHERIPLFVRRGIGRDLLSVNCGFGKIGLFWKTRDQTAPPPPGPVPGVACSGQTIRGVTIVIRTILLGSAMSLALTACAQSSFNRSEPATQTTTPAASETEPALSIERLYASPSLTGPAPRALTFSPDGERLTFLRAKPDDNSVLDLWAVNVEGGDPYMLVDSQVLAPDERELTEAERQLRERARISSTGIVRYQWDSQGDAILVPLDGDIFHVDVETSEARRLMTTDAYETDARISPDGNFVSFIRDQNLVIHNLETGEDSALTTEGGALISWGMAEFVSQEELDRRTGYWWSPDEAHLVVARVDESPVDNIERLEISGDGEARVVDQRYPRAGRTNADVTLYVIHRESGDRVQIPLMSDDEYYLARVNFSTDSETAYVQVLNRAQNRLDILAVDLASGETTLWHRETSETWINLTGDFRALSDGTAVWTSEDTPGGFRHIQHRAADGSLITQVTTGEWLVNGINHVDLDTGLVHFTGWTSSPLQRHLYSVPLDGSAAPTQITQGEGRWSGRFNADASAFIGSYSDPQTPPQTALYASDGERVRWIEENALDETHPYFPYLEDHILPQYGTLTAQDGTQLHYQLFLPADFDPSQDYPAIQYVYGGPHAQVVHQGWQSLRAQMFAQRGYVYFAIDNRGSWNRGRDFEAPLHLAMGTVEVEDQLIGLDYLKSLDFVDEDRVGLWGWSYGGYMTLMTTLQAPGAYAAGVSGAPVTDWALYDTAYTERYMSTPQANPEGYEQGSVFAHVDNYETPLFLIHGMADDNVIFANSVRLYNQLQVNREDFEMMTYPGQRHGIRGEDRSVHLWTDVVEFFDRKLKDD